MVCSIASNSNDVRIPTVPSPTVSRTKEAPGLTAYREEGHPVPRLLTLWTYQLTIDIKTYMPS